MAKGKNFAKSLGSKKLTTLIPSQAETESSSQLNEPAGQDLKKSKKTEETTVTTFRIKNDLLFSIKAIAYWDRKKIQDVLNGALESYLDTIPPASLKTAREEFKKSNM